MLSIKVNKRRIVLTILMYLVFLGIWNYYYFYHVQDTVELETDTLPQVKYEPKDDGEMMPDLNFEDADIYLKEPRQRDDMNDKNAIKDDWSDVVHEASLPIVPDTPFLSNIWDQDDLDSESVSDDHELAAIQKSSLLSDRELHHLKHKWFHRDDIEPDSQDIRVVSVRGVHGHNDGDYDETYLVPEQKSPPEFEFQQELKKRSGLDHQQWIQSVLSTDQGCLSDITCRQGSCFVRNLYVIQQQYHIFLPPAPSPLPATIPLHGGVGHDAPNITLYVHQNGCPKHPLNNVTFLPGTTSIYHVPMESTLLTVVSTAVGGLFTMNELEQTYDNQTQRILLMKQDSVKKDSYQGFMQFMAPNYPVDYINKTDTLLLSHAIVGMNKGFRIHDFWVEVLQGGGALDTRALAFRTLSLAMRTNVMGSSLLDDGYGVEIESEKPATSRCGIHRPLLCVLTRKASVRQIVNLDTLVDKLKQENLDVMLFDFANIPLKEQIMNVYQCDILVGMHHSLLAHMFFMSPGKTVIELFPYGYRKRTFQNFAQMLGLRYLYWQNSIRNRTVFHWEYVAQHKQTERPESDIVGQPLDWTNADSRMYWKNQDSYVDIQAVLSLVRIASAPMDANRFLMYMPWEQVNNQMIEFKCACAMASLLDRILVLPLMGHRSSTSDADWDFTFKITEFHWLPIEKYLDDTLFSQLPCKIMSTENFRSYQTTLDPSFTLGQLHFNPVAKATSELQLEEYYGKVLGFRYDSIIKHERMYQLSDSEVMTVFGNDESRVLCLGTVFWMYGFNKYQQYPLEKYENYMDVKLYHDIVKSIGLNENIKRIVDVAEGYLRGILDKPLFVNMHGQVSTKQRLSHVLSLIQSVAVSRPYLAIHVRRGDYWNKCKHIKKEQLRDHCYPSADRIFQVVESVLEQHAIQEPPVIYIATNIHGDKTEFARLMAKYHVVFFDDIFMLDEKESLMDSNQMAFLDVELCSRADMFIGNFYSSFSRTIFEMRDIRGLDYAFL